MCNEPNQKIVTTSILWDTQLPNLNHIHTMAGFILNEPELSSPNMPISYTKRERKDIRHLRASFLYCDSAKAFSRPSRSFSSQPILSLAITAEAKSY
ncbi:hypothetical protein L3X38_010514 [Prunus dulcis]|uniref:Uncharacterized protein n=1 Tax=Prunus dulcis TaxID=3755 RepID=A0AAD4ZEU2_PRUDU|nr:hypothetical protein L3X38_010514 [Prunus dulcis]